MTCNPGKGSGGPAAADRWSLNLQLCEEMRSWLSELPSSGHSVGKPEQKDAVSPKRSRTCGRQVERAKAARSRGTMGIGHAAQSHSPQNFQIRSKAPIFSLCLVWEWRFLADYTSSAVLHVTGLWGSGYFGTLEFVTLSSIPPLTRPHLFG